MGRDSLIIKNDCSQITLNGVVYDVKHTDLFTKEKGRIFTEKHEIKYSKGACYVYEVLDPKNKKLIMSLDNSENPYASIHTAADSHDTRNDYPQYYTTTSHVKEKNIRKFFISKFLPILILEESEDAAFLKLNSDEALQFLVTKNYKFRKGLIVYESSDKKHTLIISSIQGIHSTYNGNYISEIF